MDVSVFLLWRDPCAEYKHSGSVRVANMMTEDTNVHLAVLAQVDGEDYLQSLATELETARPIAGGFVPDNRTIAEQIVALEARANLTADMEC